MKSRYAIISIIGVASILWAEKPIDPFAEAKTPPIGKNAESKSEEFLSDSLLKALQEERLDNGVGKGRELIRITVLRSFDAPIVFNWFPAPPGHGSELEVKRLKVAINKSGERVYQEIDFHQRLRLRPSQERLLKEIYQHSPFQELPQKDWALQGLDGSEWIYESAAADDSLLITRWSPINPSLEGANIDLQRLSKELQLTAFSLMLWTLSGIDEVPY